MRTIRAFEIGLSVVLLAAFSGRASACMAPGRCVRPAGDSVRAAAPPNAFRSIPPADALASAPSRTGFVIGSSVGLALSTYLSVTNVSRPRAWSVVTGILAGVGTAALGSVHRNKAGASSGLVTADEIVGGVSAALGVWRAMTHSWESGAGLRPVPEWRPVLQPLVPPHL